MRQGVKCKLCKISCHNDCQSKAHAIIKCQVSVRCTLVLHVGLSSEHKANAANLNQQPKIKLLRRQKSAGELEVNNTEAESSAETERKFPLYLLATLFLAKLRLSHSSRSLSR